MGIPNFEGLVEAMDKLEFDLDSEASKLHNEIASVGSRGLDAIKKGGDKVAGIKARVARVEQFVNKLEGSNGGGPLSGSSNTSSEQKVEQSKVVAEAISEVIKSDQVGDVAEVLVPGAETSPAVAEPAASWGAKPVV